LASFLNNQSKADLNVSRSPFNMLKKYFLTIEPCPENLFLIFRKLSQFSHLLFNPASRLAMSNTKLRLFQLTATSY